MLLEKKGSSQQSNLSMVLVCYTADPKGKICNSCKSVKNFLVGFETCFTGRSLSGYCKPSQNPVAGEVIGPSVEATVVGLLHEHDELTRLSSK